MLLPNIQTVEIAEAKIKAYLLNTLHPDGKSKAQFFEGLGFSADSWEVLADSLRQLANKFSVSQSVESIHGLKYIIEGPIQTPSGKSPFIRTVWIVDNGQVTPRFVTAYPLDEEEYLC